MHLALAGVPIISAQFPHSNFCLSTNVDVSDFYMMAFVEESQTGLGNFFISIHVQQYLLSNYM